MKHTFSVTNDQGRTFNLNTVEYGDTYGRNDCLTHEPEKWDLGPLVIFNTEKGQQCSSYYISTLLERDQDYGLCLEGSVPEWSIDKASMTLVFNWLESLNLEGSTNH